MYIVVWLYMPVSFTVTTFDNVQDFSQEFYYYYYFIFYEQSCLFLWKLHFKQSNARLVFFFLCLLRLIS